MKIQGIGFSRGSSGSPVAIHRAVRYRTTHQRGHARRHHPPASQTKYNVRVSGYVQATKGGKWVQFKTRTWSFTTA